MPLNTPSIKYKNVKRLGSDVLLHGSDFDMAKAECARLEKERGWTNIPPYDDPYVIAGQATVAVEILRQIDNMDDLDAIFVCVGGGGLLAGVAAYVKSVAPPHVKVIGVETFDADALTQSFAKGERVLLEEVGLFADGTAVRLVGEECFRLLNSGIVDEMVLVNNDEICAAIKDIFEGEWEFAVKRHIHPLPARAPRLNTLCPTPLPTPNSPPRHALCTRAIGGDAGRGDEAIHCKAQARQQRETLRRHGQRGEHEL